MSDNNSKLGIDLIEEGNYGSYQQPTRDIDHNNMIANITVVGVGGGGCNMVAHLIKKNVKGINMVAINTDAQVLNRFENFRNQPECADVKSIKTVQIGKELTKGLGAGMKPEIGRLSAEENREEIRNALMGQDIVFIASGMGGGTGSGASAVVAEIAKETGALTISVATKPFDFEGKKRMKIASESLALLKEASDSIIEVPNNKLLELENLKNLGMKEAFFMVDEILSRAVMGTVNIILSSGFDDINLDFADFKTVMSHKGTALMGIGEATGEDAAVLAIQKSVNSPLLDNKDNSIKGSMGLLIHFEYNPKYSLSDISKAMSFAQSVAHEDADVIFGFTTSDDFAEDFVKTTIIATGFEDFELKEKLKADKEEAFNFVNTDLPTILLK